MLQTRSTCSFRTSVLWSALFHSLALILLFRTTTAIQGRGPHRQFVRVYVPPSLPHPQIVPAGRLSPPRRAMPLPAPSLPRPVAPDPEPPPTAPSVTPPAAKSMPVFDAPESIVPAPPTRAAVPRLGTFDGQHDAAAGLTKRTGVVVAGFSAPEPFPATVGRPASAGIVSGAFADARSTFAVPETIRVVRKADFGSITAGPTPTPKSAPGGDRSSALEILEKPRPAYSDEARKLKLEGEVLLEMLFGADGHARVLRVIRGLGHGLDASASQAAAGIRFRPAVRHSSPVDTIAQVKIEFQMAY